MMDKLKELFRYMNEHGLPLPLLRDHGKPSVSLTLLWISSVFVILGLLSLSIKELQINVWEALAWHVTSAVLYYNRGAKITKQGIEIQAGEKSDKQE